MKYTIHTQHCDFFKDNHCIEFEEFLNATEVQALSYVLDQALASRLEITVDNLKKKNSINFHAAGRDLWRVSPALKKLVSGMKMAQIASDLVQQKPLRLVFDQFVPNGTYLNTTKPFSETICIQGFICGVLLMLTGENTGSATYFSPDYIPSVDLQEEMLLVGYGQPLSLYIHQENDSHMHDLRKLGYNFGDRLNDKLHPLIHNLQN